MKTMIKNSMVAMSLSLLMSSAMAAMPESTGGGNGGGGHLCKNPKGAFRFIETFDLYEGKERHKLNIRPWDGISTKKTIIDAKLMRLQKVRPGFESLVRKVLIDFQQPGRVTEVSGKVLRKVSDSQEWYVDEGCEYRQIVNWTSDLNGADVILRDKVYYDRMDPLSQAAIDVHEAVYKVTRLYKFKREAVLVGDSSLVRKLVAEVFSENEIQSFTLGKQQTELGVEFAGLVKLAHWGSPISILLANDCPLKEIKISIKHSDDSDYRLAKFTRVADHVSLKRGDKFDFVPIDNTGEYIMTHENRQFIRTKDGVMRLKFSVEACGFETSASFEIKATDLENLVQFPIIIKRPLI